MALSRADSERVAEISARLNQRTPADEMRRGFYLAALETLKSGAPGLSLVTREALARSIAMKCEAVVAGGVNASRG